MTTLANSKPKISKREGQILDLLSEGNSRKMIAESLDISNHTVHSYFKKIYKKLDVNSATQAVGKLRQG